MIELVRCLTILHWSAAGVAVPGVMMRRRGAVRKRRYGAGAGIDADGLDADGTPASQSQRASQRAGAGRRESGVSATAWRRKPMPPGWYGPGGTREQVLERDGWRCRIGLADRCIGDASAVDHIDPDGPEEMDNYRAVCDPCHGWKTGVEGAKGKAQKAARAEKQRHPGYL